MGCWNGTCGVTQLSLPHGERIAYFLIANVNDHEGNDQGFCYVDDIWCPIALPIYGKYNDYGSIEDIEEGESAVHLIQLLHDYGVKVDPKSEYSPGFDPAVLETKGTLNGFETVETAIHAGILCIRDQCGFEHAQELAKIAETTPHQEVIETSERLSRRPSTFRVGLMMVNREIYEGLSTSYLHWMTEKPVELSTVMEQARSTYEGLKDYLRESAGIFDRYGSLVLDLAWGHSASRNMFIEFFRQYPIYCRQYIDIYAEKLIEHAKNGDPLPSMVTEICRFQVFRANMSALRKGWAPQAGAGSQHDNHLEHERLLQLTSTIIKDRKDRFEAENADWEEEN